MLKFNRRTALSALAGALSLPISVRAGATPEVSPVPSPSPATPAPGSVIRILATFHEFDLINKWIESATGQWASAFGAQVSITWVPPMQLSNAILLEKQNGGQHDIIIADRPMLALTPLMRDLSDIRSMATSSFGQPLAHLQASTTFRNGNVPALVIGWTPSPTIFSQPMWDSVGMHDGPATWQDALTGGTELWNAAGKPNGWTFTATPAGERITLQAMRAHGATLATSSGTPGLDTDETRAALDMLSQIYANTMSADALQRKPDMTYRLLKDQLISIDNGPMSWVRQLYLDRSETASSIRFRYPMLGANGDQMPIPPAIALSVMVPRGRSIRISVERSPWR